MVGAVVGRGDGRVTRHRGDVRRRSKIRIRGAALDGVPGGWDVRAWERGEGRSQGRGERRGPGDGVLGSRHRRRRARHGAVEAQAACAAQLDVSRVRLHHRRGITRDAKAERSAGNHPGLVVG